MTSDTRTPETEAIERLVGKFVTALLDHDVPRQRVEDYGTEIVRLVATLASEARTAALREAREAVEGLPDHSVSGYEWECNAPGETYVQTPDGTGWNKDASGQICPHYDEKGAVSRAAVLRLLGGEDRG